MLEGVYYLTEEVTWGGQGVDVGTKGFTIVINNTANGQFESGSRGAEPIAGVDRVQPYQLSADGMDTLDADTAWSNAQIDFVREMLQPNWLLVMTNHGGEGTPAYCANSGAQAAISLGSFSTSNSGPGTGFYGLFYAKNGACHASFSNMTGAFGALVCTSVQFNGSSCEIEWNPAVLPPIDPHIAVNR